MTCLYSTTFTLLSLLFVAEGRAQTTIDTHQQVHESLAGERACSSGDWRIASLAESKSLLEAYGYDSLPMRNCQAVALPWLPSAHIVQFTGTQNTDVFVSLTFVRANNTSRLWLIPVNGGLYKHFDAEDDLHNKAALNELLQIAGYRPNKSQIVDLARLYMFLVGHRTDSDSKTLAQTLKANDIAAQATTKDGWTTVTMHQVTDKLMRSGQQNWELDFENRSDGIRLVSVNPQNTTHEAGKE